MKTQDINIKDIKFRGNIRQKFNEADDISLMQSIKDNGLLQPIGVSINEDKTYTIIWGNRRLTAFKKLGFKTIPAVIFSDNNDEMSEVDFYTTNVIENLQRKSNTLFELGRVCSILRKEMSPSEIAVRLSIPKERVNFALNEIGNLPKSWAKKIQLMELGKRDKAGKIPINTAMLIGRLRKISKEDKIKLLEHTSKNDVSKADISLIGRFMREGKSINQAIQLSKKYQLVDMKLFLDKEKLKELEEIYGSVRNLYINVINAKYPNLIFSETSNRK